MKRRFIAGAICPRCAELDKIVVYRDENKEFRECVSCGFKDEMFFKYQQQELETRVNKTELQKENETQVLNFPPKK